ncbi:MAG: triphosphoribosyl-dephospho-CoA synthase [Candidatus Thorarchaeota archaeon]
MKDIAWTLASIGQLSILLEASSPKPGNVNRQMGFSDTDYRHFLASASLMSRSLHLSAERGIALVGGDIQPSEIQLGELILHSASDTFTGINRRNTILGTILLYVPLVVSCAAAIKQEGSFSSKRVVEWLKTIVKNSTVEDTINLYKAFHLARSISPKYNESTSWTDAHSRYDIDNKRVFENIKEDGLTLQGLFEMSSDVDEISNEWANQFSLTLDKVFPYLDSVTENLEDLEEGIVQTFIWLLSLRPDGLITKKAGVKRAEEVRALAEKIMSAWNHSSGSVEIMFQLDIELRKEGNLLNPGTTADLVSTAILCKLVALEFP